MTELPAPPQARWDTVLDGLASALFVGFVGILFLGYFDSSIPYATFATLPLVGSLVVLFWANLREDRFVRSRPSSPLT